ncbi:TonB-dependent receptor [Mangrovibacterium marinum]|uniref:TonB-linked SusC/RagA family outer membrane protein n=1 Tax=Mangrovibacterium marinum TaxID=1639118 RepID=A0A2T5C5J4_9BACT|nr:TonB-dependent receptor [Mangrovibacterium marinum]PTN10138.1 TonB-linked SusC/RagA family outer membrane protein [Mangrovibacterium marinum]
MKKSLLFFLTLFMFAISIASYAQQRMVSGTVFDTAKRSLPGATVVVKGTAKGTVTDVDGRFSIDGVSSGDVLVFSFIGMTTVEVPVANQTVINATLEEESIGLEEVVAVGYGTMKKSDLTGAVVNLSGEKLKESIVINPDQMMQGKVAGVQVQANSGAPGAANSIRIRGASSINNTNEPLYIIDGIPVSGAGTETAGFSWSGGSNGQNVVNPLASIAPSDIVSLDVLKDASATAIYGAAGANGVVIVTTKRGRAGKTQISYDGYVALQHRAEKMDMMNLQQFAVYQNQLYDEGLMGTIDEAYLDPSLLGKGTDWQDAVSEDAWMHTHNISMNGGTESTKFAASVGYTNQDGMLLNSSFERYTGRVNVDSEVNDYVKAGASLSYSRTDESIINNDGINGVVMQAALMSPQVPVYDFDGNYAGPESVNGSSIYNPVALTKDQDNTLLRERIMANTYAEIKPFKTLTFRSEFGIDRSNNLNKGFKPSYEYGQLKNTNIQIMQRQDESLYWIWKNYATYYETFGKHTINFMLGSETSKSSWEGIQIVKDQLTSNDIRVLSADGELVSNSGWKDAASNVSFFGRANYNYGDRYLLTATLRADASSKFGDNNRWGYFPSFAAAWRVSSEQFMENTKGWLSNLKLRLGYGQVGNANIGTYLYGSTMQAFPSAFGTAYRMSNNANPDLKWEASEQYNGGIDFGLFDSRVNLTVDAYYKTTKDLLLQPSVSPVLGGSEYVDIQTPFMNIGKVENRGLDISLNTVNISKSDFQWSSNVIFSLNRNEVKALDDQGTTIYGKLDWYAAFQTVSMIAVGQPIGVFYGYQTDGLFQDAEDIRTSALPEGINIHRTTGVWVGDVKFKDLSGPDGVPDGVINEYDQTVIGDPNPDFTFGFTNTFSYKSWELGIGLTGSVGADVLNYVRVKTEGLMSQWDNQAVDVLNRAQLGYLDGNNMDVENIDNSYLINPGAEMPRWSGNDINGNNRMSDRWIENGSYLRIQNISLSYSLPHRWLKPTGMSRCKLYLNAQNVYTFTNYSGLDPEIGSYNQQAGLSNVDMGRYPSPRIYTLGANITF